MKRGLPAVVERGRVPLIPAAVVDAVDLLRVVSVPRNYLRVNVPTQEEVHWCWAAVAVGVAGWYDRSAPGQCDVATDVLELECCPPDPDPFCNDSALLSCALESVEHLKEHIRFSRRLHDWAFIRTEIDARAPIAVRIERTEGSHAVVIHGYRGSADGILYVDDPAEDVGSNKVWYEELVSNYEGDGIWDRTYRTE